MQKIKDFYERIDQIAPFRAAESWDNVGLLIGDLQRDVSKVLLTLDITEKIIEDAIEKQIDLIICHHPVIFQSIKSINNPKLLSIIENKIAVISAHTNLDYSNIGVNRVLAERLEIKNIKPLSMSEYIEQFLISVYVPEEALIKIMSAMHEAGAGIIGNYSHCATFYETAGQFKALENSNPFMKSQKAETITSIKEIKLEMLCEEFRLSKIISVMKAAHPYETPAYYVVPLKQKSQNYGLGAYGILEKEISLIDLAKYVKEKLQAPFVKLWLGKSSEDTLVKKIAVCGGSGNIIINEAKQKADVYISSDFTYHQLLDAPLPVIDAGHFFTENLVIKRLAEIFADFECEILSITAEKHDISKLKIL